MALAVRRFFKYVTEPFRSLFQNCFSVRVYRGYCPPHAAANIRHFSAAQLRKHRKQNGSFRAVVKIDIAFSYILGIFKENLFSEKIFSKPIDKYIGLRYIYIGNRYNGERYIRGPGKEQ